MISAHLVDLSRIQFGFTALFHFLFVPLTLGLTWLLVAMEAAYLTTGKIVYRDMTQFWGKLLAINFAMGVITGITLEFEFGTNWAYFSRMIGGSFGPILAIEGITAFMLEATMFGLFFFTWDKVSKTTHFVITFFLALGASLSIVNILAANSWMQHPLATTFNYKNMSLELHSIIALYANNLSQIRVGHVAFAGFFVASFFVMGISAFYILKGRDINFAKRSFALGAGFGLVCSLAVAFFGDQNGLEVAQYEPEKMAAIEAQWTTQKAPAAWYVVALPHQQQETNTWTLKIPDALSLIATHSLTGTVEGLKPLMQTYQQRIRNGMLAYGAMEKMIANTANAADMATYKKYLPDLGYGLLLKKYLNDITQATAQQIKLATRDAIPEVSTCFWAFRFMIGFWGIGLLLILFGVYYTWKNTLENHHWFLRFVLYAIPLPYFAAEAGWVLAEVGRQPWSVHQILPTFLGVSSLSAGDVITSLSGFAILYFGLFCVEIFLMFKYGRLGPSSLGTSRYHFENHGGV